jgi:FkbH-like protein
MPDWSVQMKSVAANPESQFSEFVFLGNQAIDFLQTARLDKAIRKRFSSVPADVNTKRVRLALLGDATLDHLVPGVRVAGLRRRLWVDVYTGAYGQYLQELQDPQSAYQSFDPDTALFAVSAEKIFGAGSPAMSAKDAARLVDDAVEHLRGVWKMAFERCTHVIQQTFIATAPSLIGNNEHRLPGSQQTLTARLNVRLQEAADMDGVDLLDVSSQLLEDGIDVWHDRVLWHRAKQEISPAVSHVYGDLVGRLLSARQGRSGKCLVLDLDNTVWGGVIGDDGLEGIVLGQGSALGEAFVAFQQYAKSLASRGIILAVCSKNDGVNALAPFEQHPDMVLRRSDIACFVANWEDKPSNLRYIAQSLNIGIDSLIFADDNPFERNIVRRELPLVAVPEMPDDPSFYARTIAAGGYFEATALTADDLARSTQYQSNIQREALRSASSDLNGYLNSLSMQLIWAPFDAMGRQRITQLVNKTNQFNLTTRRYTEHDIADFGELAGAVTLQMRLTDTLGDNGIIGIVIAVPDSEETNVLRIDTWLMSCRVLGRQAEQATLNLLVQQAIEQGATALIGEYRRTDKNAMVSEHYARLGFSKISENEEGVTVWRLSLADFIPLSTFIATSRAFA